MNHPYLNIRWAMALLFAQAILLSACQAQTEKAKVAVYPGEAIYAQYCESCHGLKLKGFANWQWKHGSKTKAIRASIVEGRGEGAMPAFGEVLSDQELKELVTYLRYGLDNLQEYSLEEVVADQGEIITSEDMRFQLQAVVTGLENPWGMAFLPNGDLLVTDKPGDLYHIKSGGKKQLIGNTPEVNDGGQGGLLDITLDPDYVNNGWIYLSYSILKREGGTKLATTAVSRYHLQGDQLVDGELLFEGLPYSKTRHHYGSRLTFDEAGYLFITIGDRGARDVNPQSLKVFPGKVHRIHADGTIPKDNPFYEEAGAIQSIYSYGHRNPQGMARHPITGQIWTHEHGPRGGDELNIIKKGANYGWPVLSYGINYNGTTFTDKTTAPDMESPVHYWVPSIAPSGMDFVKSDKYPSWNGHLLLGSLKFEYLNLCKLAGEQVVSEEILMKGVGRVRNVKQGPDGFVYVAVEGPGRIFRLVPLTN